MLIFLEDLIKTSFASNGGQWGVNFSNRLVGVATTSKINFDAYVVMMVVIWGRSSNRVSALITSGIHWHIRIWCILSKISKCFDYFRHSHFTYELCAWAKFSDNYTSCGVIALPSFLLKIAPHFVFSLRWDCNLIFGIKKECLWKASLPKTKRENNNNTNSQVKKRERNRAFRMIWKECDA